MQGPGVPVQAVDLVLRRVEDVVTQIGDVLLELGELMIRSRETLLASELRLEPLLGLDDGHHGLPGEVPRIENRVCAVETQPRGIEHLPPPLLGRVDVGNDVQADAAVWHPPYSGGISRYIIATSTPAARFRAACTT